MSAPTFGSLVNSLNIFIDTSRDLGKGDDSTIQLGRNKLVCGDGQVIKLSLGEFGMYSNFYPVDSHNNSFKIEFGNYKEAFFIPPKNYRYPFDLVNAFQSLVVTHLNAGINDSTNVGALLPNSIRPQASTNLMDTGDSIMEFTIEFSKNPNLADFNIQCLTDISDSFALFGGDRVDDATTNQQSFSITESTVNTKHHITFRGLYPMQMSTEPYVYLRTDMISNNIETASLSHATGPYDTHTLTSNILAKLPMSHGFIHYAPSGPHDEFFVHLPSRHLSSIRLFLTDSRGRPLGRPYGSNSLTAAGTGASQSTLGNLNFTCTLRFDVIQKRMPNYLETEPTPQPIPGRYSGLLLNQNFGRPKI